MHALQRLHMDMHGWDGQMDRKSPNDCSSNPWPTLCTRVKLYYCTYILLLAALLNITI